MLLSHICKNHEQLFIFIDPKLEITRAHRWSWFIIFTWWRFCFLVYQWTSIVFPPLSPVKPTCRGCIFRKFISVTNCIQYVHKLHIIPDECLPWNVKGKVVLQSGYLVMQKFSVLAILSVNHRSEVYKILIFLLITFRMRRLSFVA